MTVLGSIIGSGTTTALARQRADSSRIELPEVRVEASRGSVHAARTAPFAVSIIPFSAERRDLAPGSTVAALLRSVPGIYASDRGHWALGDRITIRGMGARAGFGVRGLQLVLDGIPLTMPDGQAVTEIVEPLVVGRIEAIRGPAARFWGNGSGGAIFFESNPADESLRLRLEGGSFGARSGLVAGGGRVGNASMKGWLSTFRSDGFRQHSEARLVRFGTTGRAPLGSTGLIRWMLAGADQDVSSPGSLTAAEVLLDRTSADPRYINTASGKRSTQIQAGAALLHPLGKGTLDVAVHGVIRDLRNPLPFAWIGVDRTAGGIRATWTGRVDRFDVSFGVDAARQEDDRTNAANVNGTASGDPVLDQTEAVDARGLAVMVSTRGLVSLHGGLRLDHLDVRLDDHLIADGDQSGGRTFNAWSPSLSLHVRNDRWSGFLGWSTAFETPTTTELVNRADGLGGFNPLVGPQRTSGLETGVRAVFRSLAVDLAAYSLLVDDLLSSFVSAVDGRTYYANSGRARTAGFEVSFEWNVSKGVRIGGAGMSQRFRFDGGEHDRNVVPGVPESLARIDVSARVAGGVHAGVSVDTRSALFGDDANTFREKGCTTVDATLDRATNAGKGTWLPYVGIRNVADAACAAAIIPNARGGRYLDPAPGRSLVLGFSLRR